MGGGLFSRTTIEKTEKWRKQKKQKKQKFQPLSFTL